jgi:protease IV
MKSAKWFVLVGIVLMLPVTARAEEKNKDKPAPPGVAHIKLSGELDEAPVADSPFGASAENLKSKIERINKAAKDKNIQALYLEIDELTIGFGKLAELQRAISEFRQSGKRTYVYFEEGGAKDLLIGLNCDVIAMPESGTLMLTGMQASITFYKDTLELLKLKADILKIGDYKGAVEPFIRNDLSKENREQIESMLDDHFAHDLVAPIAKSRKWSDEKVREIIDNGPYTAKKAMEIGLINRLAYPEGLLDAIKSDLKTDKIALQKDYGSSKKDDIDFSNPFSLFKLFSPSKSKESKAAKIAVIYAVGEIESGNGGGGLMSSNSVGSTSMVEAIREAEKDATVKAIVLRVDSPGGSALASDLIWSELIKCKKPLVTSMGDVAASGGYYISMPARKIFAEPGTTTGSIGVFGMKIVTGGLKEWAGMKTTTIERGKNAGIMTTDRVYTESERKAMSAIIEDVYDQFIDKTLAGRQKAGAKLDRAKLLSIAGGHVWTGRQAKERGLVDELGTLDDAIAAAKELAGIDRGKEMELMILPHPSSFLDKLMDGDLKSPLGKVLDVPGAREALKQVGPLLRSRDPVKAMMPFRLEIH